ncbi:MAG: globin [Alphaproteobacteria bacterium]|nr:globin [Alphaproteobacteria bacterium]
MSTPANKLIEQTLTYFADHHGDPYASAFQKLYAADPRYEPLFVLDTDEGLRRNMMRTTLEMIATYIDDAYAAENLVIGARLVHLTYEIDDDFDLFFAITRDVIAEGCAEIWSDAHAAAWVTMLTDFEKARL